MNFRNYQVKEYFNQLFYDEPQDLHFVRSQAEKNGLKPIHVPPGVGKTLAFLAKLVKPKKILEIGTLGGYSTVWLAKSLAAGGKLVTLECELKHAQLAAENLCALNLQDKVDIRVGRAKDLLAELSLNQEGPFDLIFLDADKENYPNYLEPMLALSSPGTLILSDNLIPKRGEMGVPEPTDIEAISLYRFNQRLADHPRLETIVIPSLVGENGRLDAIGASLVKH